MGVSIDAPIYFLHMKYKRFKKDDYDKPNGEKISYIPDILLYEHMLGYKPPIGKSIHSPLRKDGNPSFAFYHSDDGRILWKDFATGEVGNVIKFAQLYYNTNLKGAKIRLSKAFKGQSGIQVPPDRRSSLRRKKNMLIEPKNWSPKTIKYWEQYNITKDTLNKFNVRPIESYLINGMPSKFRWSDYEPMYAMRVYKRYTIYRPLSQRSNKWRTSLTKYDLFGLEQLPKRGGETLIITKSLKDVMVLYQMGYTAIATINEGIIPPKEIIEYLKERWEIIYLFFDNDKAGMMFATKVSKQFHLSYIYIPPKLGFKDISDYVAIKGYDAANLLMKEMIGNAKQK